MKEYTIIRKPENGAWEQVPAFAIDCVLWGKSADISAQGQICYDSDALYVRLKAREAEILAEQTSRLGNPCEDSCLEFFFQPQPETDSRYFNIEFNPNACMYLGIGHDRYDLVRLLPKAGLLDPHVQRTEDGWEICYRVPLSFIRFFFPDFTAAPGSFIRANCYKCGDKTPKPHYFSWNPILSEVPDFHLPEYFSIMRFA